MCVSEAASDLQFATLFVHHVVEYGPISSWKSCSSQWVQKRCHSQTVRHAEFGVDGSMFRLVPTRGVVHDDSFPRPMAPSGGWTCHAGRGENHPVGRNSWPRRRRSVVAPSGLMPGPGRRDVGPPTPLFALISRGSGIMIMWCTTTGRVRPNGSIECVADGQEARSPVKTTSPFVSVRVRPSPNGPFLSRIPVDSRR